MHVSVDPRGDLCSSSFVLHGLRSIGCTIRFARLDDAPFVHGLAISTGDKKIWVDAEDSAGIQPEAARWADVYGKVNVELGAEGMVPLGPLFSVRLWRLPAGYLKLIPLVRGGAKPRKALATLRFMGITRLPFEVYVPGRSEPDFVFHRSRLWGGMDNIMVNAPRERFIRALQGLDLRVEATLTTERMALATYLEHTRRSAVVFNCPAVHQCLGWKLGEFLALGKAIISTSLGRNLPEPLVHGEHIHYVVDDIEAMRDAVELITGDDAYRRQLEVGARWWFDQVMAPAKVAQRLLGS